MNILGRKSRLSALLDDISRRLSALDTGGEAAAMYGQIMRARPDLAQKLGSAIQQTTANEATRELVQRAIGAGIVMQIKEIPEQINALVARINAPSVAPALRCALASVLAYIAQRRDLIPDDAPGGYGYVDDSVLLTATMLQLLEPTAANAESIEKCQQKLAGLQSVLPEAVSSALQAAIQGVILLFQTTSMLPAAVADTMTQQILDNPEGVTSPQAPPGWQMPNVLPRGAGHWSGGAYFEGNDVIIPGGPSMIDGQLYIPD
ncbi:MAG TPA: hypothetical protein PLW81_11025 [Thiobacillaceae bacterium]|nr:hypothetical protein [Thiobacillaceae bacterium]